MGADLITNSVLFPDKKVLPILKHELMKLEKGLKDVSSVADIEQLGVSIGDYENDTGDTFTDKVGFNSLLELVKEDIETLKPIKKFDDMVGRDSNYHKFTVNGVEVTCLYAGEMSWGDSPQGYTYKLLGSMCRLGLYDPLYKAIPWDMRKKK